MKNDGQSPLQNPMVKKALPFVIIAVIAVAGYLVWNAMRQNGLGEGFAGGNGRIEATEIDISAKLAGRIEKILVQEGDFVEMALYIIYNSTFHKVVQIYNIHMYTDDTQLDHSLALSDQQYAMLKIKEDLEAIVHISQQDSLVINASKSMILLFGKVNDCNYLRQHLDLSISNVQIPSEDQGRNLGLIMDISLTYKAQIQNYVKKTYCNF